MKKAEIRAFSGSKGAAYSYQRKMSAHEKRVAVYAKKRGRKNTRLKYSVRKGTKHYNVFVSRR